MKYQAIEHSKAEFPISRLCAVLSVSESGYYAWLKREPSDGDVENSLLSDQIVQIWHKFRRI